MILLTVGGCANSIQTTSTSVPTQTPSITLLPPTITSTPLPILTPTPIPVTIQEAIQRGTFAELEVLNKGDIYGGVSSGPYRDETIHLSTFTPDGKQFVAVTKRGIYAYNVKSWQELVSIPLSPEVTITSIGYSVDSSLFAAGDSTGIVTFWNIQTWEIKNSFQVYKGAVTSLDISPDNMNLVTIGDQREISIWNMNDGSLIKSQLRSKRVGPAYYSLDGKWLYISEETPYRDLIVWSSEDLTLSNRLAGLGYRPPAQAVSPYTNTIAAYGFDTIKVYDFDKQETFGLELDKTLTTSTQMIFLDEKTLMVKIFLSDYYLVDLESRALTVLSLEALSKKTFKNPEFLHILKNKEIKALGFEELRGVQNITPDGNALILHSGYNARLSGIFDLNQKTMTKVSIQDFPWDSSVFLLDGNLAGVDWTYQPHRNDSIPQQGEITVTILSPESQFAVKSKIKQTYDITHYIQAATISPDGKILAVGTEDGNLYLWNLATKELVAKTKHYNERVRLRLFFNKDGAYLAIAGQDGKIKVISMTNLSEVTSYNGREPVFSPDGNHLAYVSSDGSIRLVSLFDEDEPKVFRENISPVTSIAFSPDGNLLFSGEYNDNWDNTDRQSKLKVWLISDETLLLDLPQYNPLNSLVVSPDGTYLYVEDSDGIISVWGHKPD